MRSALVLALALLVCQPIAARAVGGPVSLHVSVEGQTNLLSNFVEDLKDAGHQEGVEFSLVDRDNAALNYRILIAQETTIASAAGAVFALGKSGDLAASVVRSGRLSGRGALNACAKELAKKLAVLNRP